MALGLVYDERFVRLRLATDLSPMELGSCAHYAPEISRHWGGAALGFGAAEKLDIALAEMDEGVGAETAAKLRLSPPLVVRTATLKLTARPAGPLGWLLNHCVTFVPLCAAAFFLALFVECPSLPALDGGDAPLSFVEVQMLAKALAPLPGNGPAGSSVVTAHFGGMLAAFEDLDKTTHGGSLRGEIQLDFLPKIVEVARHEWQVGFDEQEMRRIVAATLVLPPSPGGLVTQGGALQYRLWIAVASVGLLCGGRDMADYDAWVARRRGLGGGG